MKIFDGCLYYTVTEVAAMCGISTQSLKNWMKSSERKAEAGEERLIPPPYVAENGYKYWSAEDTETIKAYAGKTHKERYGNMSKKRGG